VAAFGLSFGRVRLATVPPRIGGRTVGLLAEAELLTTAAVVSAAAAVAGQTAAVRPLVVRPLVVLPLPEHRLAIVCAALAGLGFVARGGTHVVRGVLDKAEALPPKEPPPTSVAVPAPTSLAPGGGAPATRPFRLNIPNATSAVTAAGNLVTPAGSPVDRAEYNRGRIIGAIERMVLVLLVAAGRYEALAFMLAAKGLIRSKALESRDFAEYFIIGTLTSALLALVLGLVLQRLFTAW
jgi:hypothetical protein